MKVNLMMLSLIWSLSASAANVRAMVCRPQCLAFDIQTQEMQFLGEVEGMAQIRKDRNARRDAWKDSQRKCRTRAERVGFGPEASLVLVRGRVEVSSSSSQTGESEHSVAWSLSRRPFHRYWMEEEKHRHYFNIERELTLGFDLATPGSCVRETLPEDDLLPIYEGDLPVLG